MINGIYAIIDLKLVRGDIAQAAGAAIEGGANFIQLRAKDISTREFLKYGAEIKRLCGEDIPFIVNDRVDIALALKSDGVHLGQDDLPVDIARDIIGSERLIGLSVHSVNEAREAVKVKPDYIGVGPVFYTTTKTGISFVGVDLIRRIKKETRLPVVAIGGINETNVAEVVEAGADAVAVCSAILCSDDTKSAVEKLVSRLGA